MRLSRRSRYIASGAIGLCVSAGSFASQPGYALFAPFLGLGAGALTFYALTAWVRHSRRERFNQRFE
jgi:hypothetical protein